MKVRLTENQLRRVIKESVKRILNEDSDIMGKMQAMIDNVNTKYDELKRTYGGDDQCMDKEGDLYGFSGPIKIKSNGYVVFPYNTRNSGGYYPIAIRSFTTAGGKLRYYKDELHYDNDYRDAVKLLKTTLSDLERNEKHMEGYDPSWEDEDNSEGAKQIRKFNSSIGIRN